MIRMSLSCLGSWAWSPLLLSKLEKGVGWGLSELSVVVVVEGTSAGQKCQDVGRSVVVPNFCFLISMMISFESWYRCCKSRALGWLSRCLCSFGEQKMEHPGTKEPRLRKGESSSLRQKLSFGDSGLVCYRLLESLLFTP